MTSFSFSSHAARAAAPKGANSALALSSLEVQNPLLTFAIEAAESVQTVLSPALGGPGRYSGAEFSWQISPLAPAPRGLIQRAGAMFGRGIPVTESALMLSLQGIDGARITIRCVLQNASEYPEFLRQALHTPDQALRALHHLASVAPDSTSRAAKVSQDISRHALLPLAHHMGAGVARHWSDVPTETQRKVLEGISVRAKEAIPQAA